MASAIARVYANLCEKNGKNFNTVPKSKKEEVRELITEDGYVILEDGTVVKAVSEEAVEEVAEEQ